MITRDILAKALSWDQYYGLTQQYLTAAAIPIKYQDPDVRDYTRANLARMDRLLSTINVESKLYNLLSTLSTPMIWLVIAEPWSGDCSQILPLLHTLSTCTDHIDLRLLLRDSHPEVMSQYLTDGSQSIPKLICLQADSLADIGTWGPRPAPLQQIIMSRLPLPLAERREIIHSWYEADSSCTIQLELIDLIKKWNG